MRFEQLECLLAVEETGSFVGAAQRLFLTQQAISMSMKQLEQELGQPLLVRENYILCKRYSKLYTNKQTAVIDF